MVNVFTKCSAKVANFIIDDNEAGLEECLDLSLIAKSVVSSTSNPLGSQNSSPCKLINTKRHDKYIHTYDINTIRDTIANDPAQAASQYYEDFQNIVDDTIYTACCNCISIVLYSKTDFKSLIKYLRTIYFSVKNVERFLNDWVFRIYMDSSVYLTLVDARGRGRTGTGMVRGYELENIERAFIYYSYIVNSPNVEIYTFLCEDFVIPSFDESDTEEEIDDKFQIYDKTLARTRFLRFLTLTDPTVKTCIMREADGIVSATDCHNIDAFSGSSKIFYIADLAVKYNHVNNATPFVSYSKWLTIYKSCLQKEYFSTHNNIYDLLAGMVGFNIKIRQRAFKNNIADIKEQYDLRDVSNCGSRLVGTGMGVTEILNIGFDEIFLLNLFKNLISCEYERVTKLYNQDQLHLVLSFIMSKDTIDIHYTINVTVDMHQSSYNMHILSSFDDLVQKMKRHNSVLTVATAKLATEIVRVFNLRVDHDTLQTVLDKIFTKRLLGFYDEATSRHPFKSLTDVMDYVIDLIAYYANYGNNAGISYTIEFNSTTISPNFLPTIISGEILNRPVSDELEVSIFDGINATIEELFNDDVQSYHKYAKYKLKYLKQKSMKQRGKGYIVEAKKN